MRLGFNFTLSDTHNLVRRLVAEKHIDFCELLIDNFLCAAPTDLAKTFDCPVGFHIMKRGHDRRHSRSGPVPSRKAGSSPDRRRG